MYDTQKIDRKLCGESLGQKKFVRGVKRPSMKYQNHYLTSFVIIAFTYF